MPDRGIFASMRTKVQEKQRPENGCRVLALWVVMELLFAAM